MEGEEGRIGKGRGGGGGRGLGKGRKRNREGKKGRIGRGVRKEEEGI